MTTLKQVGNMGLARAKFFGMFFAAITIFYVGYFIWSFSYEGVTVFQLIQRGTTIFIFAFITYTIHSDIRSRTRYEADAPVYEAVAERMKSDDPTVRIQTMNVYSPGDDPRDGWEKWDSTNH